MNKLIKYMAKNNLNPRHIAQKMDMSITPVYLWAKGIRKPTIKHALLLEKITNGEVSVKDWA